MDFYKEIIEKAEDLPLSKWEIVHPENINNERSFQYVMVRTTVNGVLLLADGIFKYGVFDHVEDITVDQDHHIDQHVPDKALERQHDVIRWLAKELGHWTPYAHYKGNPSAIIARAYREVDGEH